MTLRGLLFRRSAQPYLDNTPNWWDVGEREEGGPKPSFNVLNLLIR